MDLGTSELGNLTVLRPNPGSTGGIEVAGDLGSAPRELWSHLTGQLIDV